MFRSYVTRIGQSIAKSTSSLSTTSLTLSTASSSSSSAAAAVASAANKSTPLITIYHNSNSLLSSNLFSKLNHYSDLPNKFGIDLKLNQGLTSEDYDFILNECVDIHPDNRSILMQIILGDNQSIHSHSHNHNKNKLLKHLNQLPDSPNFHNNNKHISLIIDYKNKLIANDEASFDRIMVNYLSCGIQNFQRTKPVSNYSAFINNQNNNDNQNQSNDTSNNHSSYMTAKSQTSSSTTPNNSNIKSSPSIHQNLVHPHIAEFADLF